MIPPRRTRTNRISQTAALKAANATLNLASKATVSTFRWIATDHTGMSQAMSRMPKMGFLDSMKYILEHFIISVIAALIGAVWLFLFIAYVVPYLITR